jgi:predicted DNA-binding transcriptional regulator AlpA
MRDLKHPEQKQRLLKSGDITERYAISKMTLWRWTMDPKIAFPLPIQVNSHSRYWQESEVMAWERARVAKRMKR